MEKPKRPLSAYNYFFRHQRQQLLGLDDENEEGGDQKRRVHRKTHGKYSFGEMARVIAQKWKHLDDSTRFHFEDLAAEDKKRYKQQMKIWKKGSKQEQQQYLKEMETSKQQQEHVRPAAKADTKKKSKIVDSDDDDTIVDDVKSKNPPESPVSERSAARPKVSQESDDESEQEDEVAESSEAKLRKLLHQRNNGPPRPAGMLNHGGLTRNAVAAAAASAATVAALSSLDNRSAVLRTLAGDGDEACAAAALTAINAQRIREERIHQAKMKELLNLQMMGVESQRERDASLFERSLRAQAPHDPLALLRNRDPLAGLLQGGGSATPNLDGLAPSDIRALALEARLRNAPMPHPSLLGPTPPVTESMDSRLAAYLARGGMM